MADADQSLDILVRIIQESSGLQLTQEQIGKLKTSLQGFNEQQMAHMPENAELWAKYKNVLSDTSKEADKSEVSHRALHFALQKLGLPAHELGFILHSGLVSGTTAVIGITAAWEIWNRRVEEGVKILSGFELPDLSKPAVGLSEAAQDLRGYTNALNGVVQAYNSIEAASDRAIKKIQEHLKLQKALNKLSGAGEGADLAAESAAAQDEIAEKERRRHELIESSDAKKKLANDIHVATKEQDDKVLKDLEAQNEDAQKGKAEAQARMEVIEAARRGNPEAVAQFALRYGVGTSGTQAIAIEQRTIDAANVIAQRLLTFQRGQQGRDDARSRKSKLMEESGKESGEAQNLGGGNRDSKRNCCH